MVVFLHLVVGLIINCTLYVLAFEQPTSIKDVNNEFGCG